MQIRELAIPDAWEFTPTQYRDDRGVFFEFYRFEDLALVAEHPLGLKQGNVSVSAKGVVRGIHYALVPPGQAKYVTAPRGAFIDYIIDLRVGSPTFGSWDSVIIDDVDRKAVYLSEGLGHAIVSLTDNATVSYLVSEVFNPSRELGIDVLDAEIGLVFPLEVGEPLLSAKDTAAPSLAEALASGLLPTWQESREHYASLANYID
ncbi:dTDP-4-dehydrorhamnose 3,5-epimerase [Frigoribacterium sp. CG_9.8]|uniref:dTDP-4-dehydrorhamnose 3,5-epimerase family protein n=1 Tax=Frigoribacterium sp. CG_9.8 TaxID=2787733 RepID=UPI0018C93CDA|nr:dTDP-4-dehydrorhamnose 3,5-epimerase [Frigoribacterium sp. CG_9.8]